MCIYYNLHPNLNPNPNPHTDPNPNPYPNHKRISASNTSRPRPHTHLNTICLLSAALSFICCLVFWLTPCLLSAALSIVLLSQDYLVLSCLGLLSYLCALPKSSIHICVHEEFDIFNGTVPLGWTSPVDEIKLIVHTNMK